MFESLVTRKGPYFFIHWQKYLRQLSHNTRLQSYTKHGPPGFVYVQHLVAIAVMHLYPEFAWKDVLWTTKFWVSNTRKYAIYWRSFLNSWSLLTNDNQMMFYLSCHLYQLVLSRDLYWWRVCNNAWQSVEELVHWDPVMRDRMSNFRRIKYPNSLSFLTFGMIVRFSVLSLGTRLYTNLQWRK